MLLVLLSSEFSSSSSSSWQIIKLIMNRRENNVLMLWLSAITISFSFSFRSIGRFPFRSVLYSEVSDVDHSNLLATESYRAPLNEIDRRRNFAIISHPDAGRFWSCSIVISEHQLNNIWNRCRAGKTTLTEKLLLFGGAIQDAGAVKARADQRKATSDWMEIEKARSVLPPCSSTKGFFILFFTISFSEGFPLLPLCFHSSTTRNRPTQR